MTSPDVAAAAYVPQWRGRPIPRPGDLIKMLALVHTEGSQFLSQRHVGGVVDTVTLDQAVLHNDLLIRLVDDPIDYILRQATSVCDWVLEAPAVREPESEPEPAPAAEPIDPTSIVALERRLLAITTRLAALKGEEEALKAEVATLNEQIRETALAEEMESLPGVDGMSAYFCPIYHVERRVDEATGKPFTTARLVEALRASGHDYLVSETANGNQVRALMREIVVEHEQDLPPALAEVAELKTRYDVRFTPMGARKTRAAPQRGD